MTVNVFLIAVSFGFLSVGFQAFSCQVTPAPDASTPTPSPYPQAPEPALIEEANPLLPPLSEAEIQTLQTELTQGIDTWFALAGLSKVVAPPPLSATLQDYRAAWSMINTDVTTFLGLWRDSEDYPYSLSIFPSTTPGQVCVLEFKPEWSLSIFNESTGEYGKDVISEQILSFSIATVEDGHLRSNQVRSVGSATAVARFTGGEPYSVLFMGLMDDQGTTRVVALTSPPTLPTELPDTLVAPITQTLLDHGCITDP